MGTKKTEKTVEPVVVIEKQDRLLKCDLTQDELLAYAAKMADAQQTVVELEAEAKAFKEQNTGAKTMAEGSRAKFAALVRQRYEHRTVECEVVRNYTAKTITVNRLDTGAAVETRPMTDDEVLTLPL